MKNIKSEQEDEALLYARLRDLLSQCSVGRDVYSEFLNPKEQFLASRFLEKQSGAKMPAFRFWGGYPQAERKILCLFSEDTWAWDELADKESGDSCGQAPVAALFVRGSGFRALSHRDYLGALLSLGLERRVIGDICILNQTSAAIFLHIRILTFVTQNLQKVSADTVTVAPLESDAEIPEAKRFETLSLTVASLRLDCIVSAVTGVSREKAKQMIVSGRVEVNFTPVYAPDFFVNADACLSVKGVGRFLFDGTTGSTKKGNARINIRKYL